MPRVLLSYFGLLSFRYSILLPIRIPRLSFLPPSFKILFDFFHSRFYVLFLLFTFYLFSRFFFFSPLYFLFITNFMNSLSLTNYLIFSRIFYQFISGSCLSFGWGRGTNLLPCIFVTSLDWFLLTLTPLLVSALVPLFIILPSAVPHSFVAWAVWYIYHS